jgi:hypothetical protein
MTRASTSSFPMLGTVAIGTIAGRRSVADTTRRVTPATGNRVRSVGATANPRCSPGGPRTSTISRRSRIHQRFASRSARAATGGLFFPRVATQSGTGNTGALRAGRVGRPVAHRALGAFAAAKVQWPSELGYTLGIRLIGGDDCDSGRSFPVSPMLRRRHRHPSEPCHLENRSAKDAPLSF